MQARLALTRLWRTRPRWLLAGACACLIVSWLISSNAGIPLLTVCAALLLSGLWMLIWLLRLLWQVWRRSDHAPSWTTWCWEPALLLLSLALSCSPLLAGLRFWLSESALEHYATEVRSHRIELTAETRHPTRWVGLFAISHTELLVDGTLRVQSSEDGLFGSAGFAQAQTGTPRSGDESHYVHLHGHWWRWRQSW